MNLKVSIKYQLNEYKKSIIIFYFIILCVLTFMFILANNISDSTIQFGGMEMSSIIFIFVIGLNSFKESFRMHIQNGVSRKTMVIGKMISALAVCIGMAFIDRIIALIGNWISSSKERFIYKGILEQTYNRSNIGSVQMQLDGLLFNICLYLAIFAIGYFVTIAYYRMNNALKLAVSVGVPVGLFVILPIVEMSITGGRISKALSSMFDFAFGFSKGNPYYAMVTGILMFAIFGGLSWLMVRKAVDKN